jgi:ssDNA-binding Zn-finger/Zn-ribbon topoisomerase 1
LERDTISRVPRKQKINLERVKASLETVCPKCGCPIAPDKIRRIDFRQVECPECGEHFIPEKREKASQDITTVRAARQWAKAFCDALAVPVSFASSSPCVVKFAGGGES